MFIKLSFILFSISTIIFSCNDSIDNSGQSTISNEQGSICPLKNVYKLPNPNIQGVNVFMDASGSMRDFMPSTQPSTDFQKLIPDLLSRLNSDFPGFSFYALVQKNKPINIIDINTIKKQIAYGQFIFGQSSPLPVMFDSVISHSNTGYLSILITDAIYSLPANIKNTRDQVITDIREKVLKAQGKGLAISCFGLKSQLGNIVSPYYLFVIASPQNITAFKEKLKNTFNGINPIITNKDFSEINFGYPDLNPFYSIIPYVENTGAGEPAPCPDWDNRYLLVENVKIRDDPEFWIGINLSACPKFAQEIDYLKNNLLIENKGLNSIRVDNILTKAQFSPKLKDAEDIRLNDNCTHFFRIKITEMQDRNGVIKLSLKKTDPTWLALWNHDNSQVAESYREKTYGLSNVIAGIKDAYTATETGYFFKELKIVITK